MKKLFFTLTAVAPIAACSAAGPDMTGDEAPFPELDGVEVQQTVTSSNADGTWTATATTYQTQELLQVYGVANFTGPGGGKTRKMGLCITRRYAPGVACTGDGKGHPINGECNNAPTSLPAGGDRYCLSANNTGTKYCHYRAGNESGYCAGSPVTGTAILPGSYSTPHVSGSPSGTYFLTLACFEGCNSVVGSMSPWLMSSSGGSSGGPK